MKKVLIATKSNHKLKEIEDIICNYDLEDFEFITLNDLDENFEDVEETGTTLEENAYIKAMYYASRYDLLIVSDDSGLFVPSLHYMPGVHSKRYSESGTDYDNNMKLFNEIKGKDKKAYFECCICLIDENKDVFFFNERTTGHILDEITGTNGFGYDHVFFSNELQKPMGQALMNEKRTISHRGKAIRKLLEFLEERNGK